MSRSKRGKAQTPPQVPPAADAVRSAIDEAAIDEALRLQHGSAELSSALKLEIGVGPARTGEPEEQVPLPLPEAGVEQYARPPEPEAPSEATEQALEPESQPEPASAQVSHDIEHRMEQGAPARALGRRFAEARAAQGLSLVDAARRLRFPIPVLADIEADRYEALGAPIYARSYLKSYARLVQLPEAALGPVFASFEQVEPAIPPAVSAHSRPLAPRLATPALYALLTMLLVVPVAVQLYQRSRAPLAPQVSAPERTAAREVALDGPARTGTGAAQTGSGEVPPDSPPEASAESAAATGTQGVETGNVAADRRAPGTIPAQPSHAAEPILASLAPMPTRTAPTSGQHVRLQLAESSWVELTGADGSRIEYAMLPGGTTREYQVAGKASLRIGNSRGASLSVDGQPVDLSSFARANVARVSLGEAPAPPAE